MTARRQLLALLAVAAVMIGGVAMLYRLRLGQGDFFPAYSTLRADPLGVRALHDSLAALPGSRVTRWRQPIAALAPMPARTVMLAGFSAEQWNAMAPADFAALDAAVRNGSRLVIAMRAARFSDDVAKTLPARTGGDGLDDTEKKNRPAFADLAQEWGIKLKRRELLGPARQSAETPGELPNSLRWESDNYFAAAQGVPWETIYRRGLEPVVVERQNGRGSIVLMGDAYALSNEALHRDRSAALLAWLVGPQSRVEFVESHLGLTENPGVAALARRYGLAPAFFTLAVLAGLFVWRRMALFVPPAEDARSLALDYNQTAGLEALLRRAVPPVELIATCTMEWRRTARTADVARVEAVIAALPKDTTPAIAYNAVVRTLRRS